MAADPAFTATPNVNGGLVPATLDTSLTAPTNITTVWTAGASGGKVEEIVCQGVGTTVAGVINVWRHDGSNYRLIDQFLIVATTSSTTARAWRENRTYENLLLKPSETIRVSQTVSGNQSLVMVSCFGGDF